MASTAGYREHCSSVYHIPPPPSSFNPHHAFHTSETYYHHSSSFRYRSHLHNSTAVTPANLTAGYPRSPPRHGTMGKPTRLVSTTTRTPLGVTQKQTQAVSSRKQQKPSPLPQQQKLKAYANTPEPAYHKLDSSNDTADSNRLYACDMTASSADSTLPTDDEYATHAGDFGSSPDEYSAPRLRTMSYSSDLDGSEDGEPEGATEYTGSTTLCSNTTGAPLLPRSASMKNLAGTPQDLPVLSLSDDKLHATFRVRPEAIAAGNWGRVYIAGLRKRASGTLGSVAAAFDGGVPGCVALKVVDRHSDDGVS